jgi:hypothetical protein
LSAAARTSLPARRASSGAKPAELSPLGGAGQSPRPASQAAEPPSGARPASAAPRRLGAKPANRFTGPPPLRGSHRLRRGVRCGWVGGKKEGVSGRFSGSAACFSVGFPPAARASVGPPLPLLAPSRAEPLAGAHRHPPRRVHREDNSKDYYKSVALGVGAERRAHRSPQPERALDSGLPAQLQACFAELRQLPLAP